MISKGFEVANGQLKCAYQNCGKVVNAPYDKNLCLFHAPKENKGLSVESFNKLIISQLKRKDFNCKGYIFPGEIQFPKEDETLFAGNAKFRGAHFTDTVKFIGIKFLGYADFRGAQFSGIADFREAQFGRLAVFNKAQFAKIVAFHKAKFAGDADFLFVQFASRAVFKETDFSEGVNFDSARFFRNTEFHETFFSRNALFHNTKFLQNVEFINALFSDVADFSKAQFSSDVTFKKVQFSRDVIFTESQFSGVSAFEHLKIYSGLNFTRIKFTASAIFKISSPLFIYRKSNTIIIEFSHVIFNPDKVFFEGFKKESAYIDFDNNTIVLFRYCNLKDVYFSNNDLGMFSFYNSTFDQARFIANNWQNEKAKILPIYKRKNILLDEILFNQLNTLNTKEKKKFSELYSLENLDNYEIIAGLYHRMKAALDYIKEYNEASWFYYNEFEMKRKALKERFKSNGFFSAIGDRLRYRFYGLYKQFAGYGEKPIRSFLWFIFSSLILFPLIHLSNGLYIKFGNQLPAKYNLDFSKLDFLTKEEFWNHFVYAMIFSIYRLLPLDYLPLDNSVFMPDGPSGLIWSFINSVVLILLLVFTGVGLKRHFRRF